MNCSTRERKVKLRNEETSMSGKGRCIPGECWGEEGKKERRKEHEGGLRLETTKHVHLPNL